MTTQSLSNTVALLNTVPAKIMVAFNALAYCQSITDSENLQATPSASNDGINSQQLHPSQRISQHERGLKLAALNLIRDYLNGEIELPPMLNTITQSPAVDKEPDGPIRGPWLDDAEDEPRPKA